MRIRGISIDGYGRFGGQNHEFAPGLQVVVGPNERGKSTLRAFIADMLYGQKRHPAYPDYDESRELRTPWDHPERYGGSLLYELDSGRRFEVIRCFVPERESLEVWDRSEGREVTGEFERLRNGEVDFAGVHLGISKEVFLGAATISHLTLEELAEGDAMNRIRERLLALADSGAERSSAETALRRLDARLDAIGRNGAKGRPLTAARVRLDEVNKEYRAGLELQGEIAELEEQRREALRQVAALRAQRASLEAELALIDAHERASRLREAENLQTRIETATQHCFALGAAVREFPLGQLPEVQRAETRVATAQMQVKRTRDDLKEAKRQFDAEYRRLGAQADGVQSEINEEMETRLNEVTATIQRIRERLAELDEQVLQAQAKLDEAQEAVNRYPDFGRLAPDPVAWLTQLSSSFDVAIRARDEECSRREQVRREVAHRHERVAPHRALFDGCPDFSEKAREFELMKRMLEEQRNQLASYLQSLQNAAEEIAEKLPGLRFLAAGLGLFLAVLLSAFFYLKHVAILLPAGFTLVAVLYFILNLRLSRARLAKVQHDLQESREKLADLERQRPDDDSPIAVMMRREKCETVRELEARYDAFRTAAAELAARREVLDALEMRAAEAEERVARLLERFRDSFAQVGEEINGEGDIKRAAGRAVSRYQEYREAKSRLTDCRNVLDRLQSGRRKLQSELESALNEETELAHSLRETLREYGFEEERQHESVAAALRAYRQYTAAAAERRARVKLLQENVHALERQVKAEELDLEKCEQTVGHLLARAGVSSIEQWHRMAEQAREYREVWAKRASLQEQLDSLLRGEDLLELRAAVESAGELPPPPARTREDLKTEVAECTAQAEEWMHEEHRVHLEITERTAGARTLNEIEEERALLERQVADLELEFEATTYAIAQIEAIARDKHARIAPALAETAGHYLDEITGGAYSEIRIERDFSIGVGLPQSTRVLDRPEKSLSKGTIDQVYLALRLALVQAISHDGEKAPMLLDDPFANYDDARLERTMRLLARIAKHNQILLFTCRDDVAHAAMAVNAPILRL